MTTDSRGTGSTILLSNARPFDMLVWLEPWCDELTLAPRGKLTISVEGGEDPEIETTEDRFIIYAAAGTLIHVAIDDVVQDTGSAEMPVPDAGNFTTREFMQVVFGDVPEARPGGAPCSTRSSRWPYLRRLFSKGVK